jgi:hypothetical protein
MKDDSGLAYPWGEHGTRLGGLTKREEFAKAAMQGMCAAADPMKVAALRNCIANCAVEQADALLAALEDQS